MPVIIGGYQYTNPLVMAMQIKSPLYSLDSITNQKWYVADNINKLKML